MLAGLLALVGIATNISNLAILLLVALSMRAKQDVDDMVSDALSYVE